MADGKEVRRVDRTFNRFHLLTEEKTTQAHCVKRVLTTYYAKDEPFDNQVPQYQLPTDILTSWEMENDSTQYRAEETSTQFDDHGNLIEEVQADKIKTTYSYYSKDGEDGCPPDPEGFVRNRKDTTVYPSPLGQGDAPTLRTRYRYSALVPLTASGLKDWLVVDSETLLQVAGSHETELQQTLRSYVVEPANAFLHGRPLQQRETLNGKTTTTDYQYKPDSVLAGETVLQTVETLSGFDHVAGVNEVQKVITREDSRVHGQPLLTHDDNNVTIRYTYDLLERVTSETVAPGETEFEATRYYEYYLTSLDGQQAEQVVTDVKEVKTRTRFDGLNRPIYEERQNADSLLRAKDYRQTYAGVYDALGNLIKETDYDWEDENPVPLTSLFEYDAWGAQRSVTGPDRVTVYEETDPIGTPEWRGPIQRSWRQGVDKRARTTGVTETWLNLFEKPAQSRRFESRDPGEKPVSLHQYSYDGLGRTTQEVDARDAKTQYSYDVFGRMLTTTLPGGAVVRRSYAEHSPEDLPTEISVNNIVLGKQWFDGLNRMTRSITGGREQVFTYEPGQTQPATVTTASKQLINYVYQPKLGEEPLQRRLPNSITADYEYDKKNARLISCKEQDQQLVRQYFSTGELKAEQRVQGGESYSMHYSYSRHARLLSYTDVLKQTQSYHYDLAGRLQRTELGTTTSSFTYDGLSQTETIHTEDSVSGQSVTISLEYDAFGRETKRTFDLDGVEQQLTQVYNEVDALVQRTLYEGQTLLRDEKYDYDPRGRLVIYECEGIQRPVDPYGKAITQQLFRFDALDNLTRVITTTTDGITTYTNQAIYTFDTTDPTQLLKVTNTGDPTYPAEILLSYDENGNLTRDEENRTLEYDALNRLISVSGLPGETPSGFDYDALDRLAGLNDGAEQRFYQDGALATRIQGAQRHTFMRGEGNLLAEQQEGAGPKSLLLASDNKNTVLREIGSDGANDIAYSAYGYRSAEQPLSTHLGYNGQFRETQTGCYLLGNGYRAYNPWLMRFCSPDSWSPFGEGGLNAYTYCGGEPIMNADDSGHMFNVVKNLFSSRPKVPTKLPDPPATPKPPNAFREKIANDNERWDARARAETNPHSGTRQASGSYSPGNTGMPGVKQSGGAGIQTNNETDSFYSNKAKKVLDKAEEQYLKTIQKLEASPPLPPTVSSEQWKKMDVFARDAHVSKGGLLPNDVQVQKVRRTALDRSKKSKKSS
ncbi:hypothetical protein PS723_06425 [Pseudomonas fluorescens]|uniref:Uncharacterized protein n=2 Tax=Pseudomonas fluorescens TaxID=294 RepID=A0A5E7FYC0_PSEFL|nr:hypothetical protein PS723_06425 [Pseudomonas fluorescens]